MEVRELLAGGTRVELAERDLLGTGPSEEEPEPLGHRGSVPQARPGGPAMKIERPNWLDWLVILFALAFIALLVGWFL